MKTASTFYTLLLIVGSSSCGVIPIGNHFEKAGTLKKGNVEIEGNISNYGSMSRGLDNDASAASSSISMIGGRIGIGLSDKTDLKFRFEQTVNTDIEEPSRQSFFSIIPKFAIEDDQLSLLLPFSIYSYQDSYLITISGSIAPQLLYTLTSANKKADLTLSAKGDLLFGEYGAALLFGVSVGAGFSSDLSKWAIRPELGATFLGGGGILSYGLGFQYTMPKRKR